MKKCPVCEKTFEDSMRFCQTDGTPLVEFVEAPAEDPLKTTVVRQEDFASVIPPEDPFKSSSVESKPKDDSGDLLQLPEEYDPMKTMVAPNQADFGLNLSEPKKETPVSPFDTPFEAKIEEKLPEISVPEPPKFSEPNLSPPSFGDMSSPMSFDEKKDLDEPPPTAIYMPEANSFPPESSTPMSSSPFDRPMEKPLDAPIPSPFDSPTPQYPSFKDPEPFTPAVSPFEQPASPFGGIQQQDQGFNQPVQNSDWSPQTPAASNWQDQGGANAQFPPVAGAGQDQTMAIISLVCSIAGLATCITAPVGLVLGYMARKKAQENPQQYGGEGLALAGMIIGGILTLLFVLFIAFYVLIIFGAIASSF